MNTRANTPETLGAAIEVPLMEPYMVFVSASVLKMLCPGAAMSFVYMPAML